VTGEQIAFGSELRRERERRKISLADVAESTKIKQSLLASLERGDASHWPAGLYRRAFFREYTAALGLPSEAILGEFLRLFPESGTAVPPRIEPADPTGGLRLTLASERRWSAAEVAFQAAAALTDAGVVLAIGAGLSWLFGVALWSTTAVFAVAYYSLATTSLGKSPVLSLIGAATLRRADLARETVRARPSSRDLLHIVPAVPRQAPQPAGHDFTQVVENARTASR
jgi:transcriptional regulator with XRE-family HTH domain